MEKRHAELNARLETARNFGLRRSEGAIRSYFADTEGERIEGLKAEARAERQFLDWQREQFKPDLLS